MARYEGKTGGAGTHEDPVRFEWVKEDDLNRQKKLAEQREKFTRDAKAGKVICISDLFCSHGM
jgi:hypothetical protein